VINNQPIATDRLAEVKVYAAKHKTDDVRLSSSSGGIFTAISDWYLSRGGIVYGAAFDSALKLRHSRATTSIGRDNFRGSKYLQSELSDVFVSVRADLQSGKDVMFVGTPCQCSGLSRYLGKDYPKLLNCDFVCHGVPSPKIFYDYLVYVSRKFRSEITAVSFREKVVGWHRPVFCVTLQNSQKRILFNDDQYCRLFGEHLVLRPSCHKCQFTNFNRPSDITMGDFWSIPEFNRKFDDDKGTSLVLVNTEKGRRVFDGVSGDIVSMESTCVACLQPNLTRPSKPSSDVGQFWKDYQQYGFEYVCSKYVPQRFMAWEKVRIIILLKKYGLLGLFCKVRGLFAAINP
jgi:coenzyme F420-reducing hydrogenase beta subunit